MTKIKIKLTDLLTDEYGIVYNRDNLIQIKIWRFKKNSIQLIGTIIFHKNYDDYIFQGIINRNNYKIFTDIWLRFCISDFIVEQTTKWSINFNGSYNVFRPVILTSYNQFIREYPEYRKVSF